MTLQKRKTTSLHLLIVLSLIFLFLKITHAAPYPVSGSSIFLDKKKNLFLKPYKFSLNLEQTIFETDLSQDDPEKWSVKSSTSDMQIFIRTRTLGPKEDYDKTLRAWIREYEKSGFQIVTQQIPQKNAESGWIHLQDPQDNKQLIQNFRYQNRTWIYINCLGTKNQIQTLKQSCTDLSSRLRF